MSSPTYDLVIKNGFIIDGTGNPGFKADLAIKGEQITEIASQIDKKSQQVIDAKGKNVVPGFIDPHVHEEFIVLEDGKFEAFLRQGVTTIINGNCGHSVTPGDSKKIFEYMYKNGLLSSLDYYAENQWCSLQEYIKLVKNKGFNINMGILLGHGTIRWSVMGGSKNRKPTKKETELIAEKIKEGLKAGALGLSTGLAYIPSKYADTKELIKAAELVRKEDGIYTSHLRSYIGVLKAVKEAIQIGKSAKVRVQVSHLTPTVPEAFDEVLKAREAGLEIAIDTIPKSSGHCIRKDRLLQSIMASVSDLFEKGLDNLNKALKDPQLRNKIKKEARIFSGKMSNMYLINTDDKKLEEKSLASLSKEYNKDPKDLLLDLLLNDKVQFTLWNGGFRKKEFPGTIYPDNIADNPLVMVGSDRIFGENNNPYVWYELFRTGAFPIFFNMMKEKGVRTEEIIRRLTSLPAQQFRLTNRGLLKQGMKADISIIDFEQFSFPDDKKRGYKDPLVFAEGVKYVIVNGQVVLKTGIVENTKAGSFLGKNGRVL
ncbi:MAG TPA: amidohydrolase family protein [Halanaerobiales bacterium]|nr:amidohydrolase family protein [Halanaerobiales bacterium]